MSEWTNQRIDQAIAMLVAAAVKGERCPMTQPHGPLPSGAIGKLVSLGMIRSEVSGRNYRQVFILKGEHTGKRTAPHPAGSPAWRVNGCDVDLPRPGGPERREPSPPRLLAK